MWLSCRPAQTVSPTMVIKKAIRNSMLSTRLGFYAMLGGSEPDLSPMKSMRSANR